MMVTPANVTDRDGAAQMLFFHRGVSGKFSLLEKILADGAYTGAPFSQRVQNLVGAEVEVVKRSELHTFAVIPKRWIVERTFGRFSYTKRLEPFDYYESAQFSPESQTRKNLNSTHALAEFPLFCQKLRQELYIMAGDFPP